MPALAPLRFLALAALLLAPSWLPAAEPSLPPASEVRAALEKAQQYFLTRWPRPGTRDGLPGNRPSNIWTRSVYFEGAMALYRLNQDPALLRYMEEWGTFHQWSFRNGPQTENADDQAAAQIYLELFQLDPAREERIAPARLNAERWTRSSKVNFYTWIDALQMSMPVFARLAAVDHQPAYLEKMFALYDYTRTTLGLYNPADGLWWRDVHFKPPVQTPAGQPVYWSRGNGWVLAALVRVLDILPPEDPHRAEYETVFRQMCAALLPLQREDGFWNASLRDPAHFGGPEATGTSLFLYGFAWGVKKGLLPAPAYVPAVVKGWQALVTKALHPDGFLGYVQGTGDEPSDGQPVTYDSRPDFDDYGVGCFLLAGSEICALQATVVPEQAAAQVRAEAE